MTKAAHTIQRSQEAIAKAGGRHIGDLVTWNFADVDVSRVKVRALFDGEQFLGMVPDLDPETALARAVGEARTPSSLTVERFSQPNKDSPVAFGVYVKKTVAGESGDNFLCGARVRISSDRAVTLPPEGGVLHPDAAEHAAIIATKANHIMTHAKARDLGGALVNVLKQLNAVPFRDKGGVYLLPVSSCERWSRLADGLEKFGVTPVTVQMHDAPSNVKAAAGAAKGALEEELLALKADMEKAATDGMRPSTMRHRVEDCNAIIARADLYRGVLEDAAAKIAARANEIKARFQRGIDGDLEAFTLVDAETVSEKEIEQEAAVVAPPTKEPENDVFKLE